MTETIVEPSIAAVRAAFEKAGIEIANLDVRQFPGETILVVEVIEQDLPAAIDLANSLDASIENGFITVRRAQQRQSKTAARPVTSLTDPRVTGLVEVLNARSRTSEQQPSLQYIEDAANTVKVATSRRHHLIFGRRGVGKTALMLEAKRIVSERGAVTLWMNLQSLRYLDADRAFLSIAGRFCDLPEVRYGQRSTPPNSLNRARAIRARIDSILQSSALDGARVSALIPEVQQFLRIFCEETQSDVFIFLDDIHYMPVKDLPKLLDRVHGTTRDISVWIKAAGIKHQCRWFTDNPPTGLQTGHDAAIINLDITLEEPAKAKKFLVSIFRTYLDEARISNLSEVASGAAIDRLVLASGGVPRDFLVLSGTAVVVARQRPNARLIGVQDVNEAAGRTAQIKLQELEDDAASSIGTAGMRNSVLRHILEFLLQDKQFTYFRIDFRDKDGHPREYNAIQSLMDLRMVHLINASLSDEHHAGHRSEVYMLDLSQFSGTRFKHNLRVLDFTKNYLVLKSTGSKAAPRLGDTPRKLQGILRRGPVFDLERLSPLVSAAMPSQ